jgi:hypothetical protein
MARKKKYIKIYKMPNKKKPKGAQHTQWCTGPLVKGRGNQEKISPSSCGKTPLRTSARLPSPISSLASRDQMGSDWRYSLTTFLVRASPVFELKDSTFFSYRISASQVRISPPALMVGNATASFWKTSNGRLLSSMTSALTNRGLSDETRA